MASVRGMVAAAKAGIENLTPAEVAVELDGGGVLLVDVREPGEIAGGVIPGAVLAPRGMLEFHADPATPYHLEGFHPDRRVIVYCAPAHGRLWVPVASRASAIATWPTSMVASRRGASRIVRWRAHRLRTERAGGQHLYEGSVPMGYRLEGQQTTGPWRSPLAGSRLSPGWRSRLGGRHRTAATSTTARWTSSA